MPTYEVEIPNLGKFEVKSDRELSEQEIITQVQLRAGGEKTRGELGRQLGLTARAGLTGVAGLPLMAGEGFAVELCKLRVATKGLVVDARSLGIALAF